MIDDDLLLLTAEDISQLVHLLVKGLETERINHKKDHAVMQSHRLNSKKLI